MATKTYEIIDGVEKLTEAIAHVRKAQQVFATYTQEQVDKIFLAAASAANKARIPLAKMAVEETGMGIVEDKVIKNNYASEYIYNAYKDTKTCGIIEEDKASASRRLQTPSVLLLRLSPLQIPHQQLFSSALLLLRQETLLLFLLTPEQRTAQ